VVTDSIGFASITLDIHQTGMWVGVGESSPKKKVPAIYLGWEGDI
jgi:hypothetical protein